jgi:hypothetical protein
MRLECPILADFTDKVDGALFRGVGFLIRGAERDGRSGPYQQQFPVRAELPAGVLKASRLSGLPTRLER